MRYKLVEGRTVVAAGAGYTINMGSGGVAFSAEPLAGPRPGGHPAAGAAAPLNGREQRSEPVTGEPELRPGTFIELSISWPALLDQTCPMRLIVFGRVLRGAGRTAACTLDKYEFRTARVSKSDA
ncbi:MAG: hypothetical protein ABSH44_13790 [Bryobacteraceae bacterium]